MGAKRVAKKRSAKSTPPGCSIDWIAEHVVNRQGDIDLMTVRKTAPYILAAAYAYAAEEVEGLRDGTERMKSLTGLMRLCWKRCG